MYKYIYNYKVVIAPNCYCSNPEIEHRTNEYIKDRRKMAVVTMKLTDDDQRGPEDDEDIDGGETTLCPELVQYTDKIMIRMTNKT